MRPDAGALDDREIVERVAAGEAELFSLLVQRHQRAVYGLGIGFFKNADDAGDFVQDVFLRAYRNLPGFLGKAKFSTWLYRIAYNTAVNAVKRRKEYQSLADDAEIPYFDDPQEKALRETSRAAIRKAVDGLPERYRVCLDLYFFYDLSYPEIEVVTGFPVNTIKSHVFRAKAILREKLRDEAEGGSA